jgi:hypothetical protein
MIKKRRIYKKDKKERKETEVNGKAVKILKR